MLRGDFETMAKKKNKQNKAAGSDVAAEAKPAAGRSVLEQTWLAYQAGDVVTARRGAEELLSGTPSARDESFAEKLAPELFGKKDAIADVKVVAGEIRLRTTPPTQAYWFAALCAFVFAVLLLIARRG
jgi:hypothetical protein